MFLTLILFKTINEVGNTNSHICICVSVRYNQIRKRINKKYAFNIKFSLTCTFCRIYTTLNHWVQISVILPTKRKKNHKDGTGNKKGYKLSNLVKISGVPSVFNTSYANTRPHYDSSVHNRCVTACRKFTWSFTILIMYLPEIYSASFWAVSRTVSAVWAFQHTMPCS